MKNSVEHPRRKSREAVMMALYALEIHNNVNEKSETGPLPSASILDDILSRKSFDEFFSCIYANASEIRDNNQSELYVYYVCT